MTVDVQTLERATEKILPLTPPVGRGRRQIRDEIELCHKVEQILKTHRVERLLNYDYDYQLPTSKSEGRYQITQVTPNRSEMEKVEAQLGWRAYVTNAPKHRLSLSKAVLTSPHSLCKKRNKSNC